MKQRLPRNLVGLKWDRLEVKSLIGLRKTGYYWLCQCQCGCFTELRTTQITRRLVKSCGCLAREILGNRSRTYGEGRTPLAAIWRAMIARCHNPKSTAYSQYGAKGVVVCERWRNSFLDFKSDVGTPLKGQHLDRFPNSNGNYEPGNVRWTSCKNNQRNRRNNILATINGVTKTAIAWMEELGVKISYGTFWNRIKLGWTVEEAILTPLRRNS